jgi:hypothetical protein
MSWRLLGSFLKRWHGRTPEKVVISWLIVNLQQLTERIERLLHFQGPMRAWLQPFRGQVEVLLLCILFIRINSSQFLHY